MTDATSMQPLAQAAGSFELVDAIGLLPGELRTAEVTIRSCLTIDGTLQIEIAQDCTGTQVEDLLDGLLDDIRIDMARCRRSRP